MGRGHAVFLKTTVQTFHFYFLKLTDCSSRCASSHFTFDDLYLFFDNEPRFDPFLYYPSFPVQCGRPRMGEPIFPPGTCMINV